MSIKVGTKLATISLERAQILPQEAHPHPKLETAAIAMYKDPWWRTVQETTQWNGIAFRRWGSEENNTVHGEFPWR